ncbi:MAG: homoserine kinase [Gammaproteobacteria bacterium]|nr:homoserine kinase [Gammaproteobacteria bacterium]
MSVYTSVSKAELEAFIARFDVGTLTDFEGISAGIENTNYFVTTSERQFILTLFESTPEQDLPFFLDLMAYLADHNIPSAHPVADRGGAYLHRLNGRATALVERLPGASLETPGAAHCADIGRFMANMHNCTERAPLQRDNDRGPKWRDASAARLRPVLDDDELYILEKELELLQSYSIASLPRGVIHADLFRDNALYTRDELTGVIDFYYAHSGPFIYDVAVTVNDWCFSGGHLHDEHTRALLSGYLEYRHINGDERAAFPVMLRAAAVRFWLSRLVDQHFPREGELTQIKNPWPFRQLLAYFAVQTEQIAEIWDTL